MRNFTNTNDQKDYILATNKLNLALTKDDFEEKLLNLNLTETNDFSNEEIYALLMSGKDKFNRSEDFDIDIGVTLYDNPSSNVIGYTYPYTWRTWINQKYLRWTHDFLAGHKLHEYLHNMGFRHDGEHATSVPYQLGKLVREIV